MGGFGLEGRALGQTSIDRGELVLDSHEKVSDGVVRVVEVVMRS